MTNPAQNHYDTFLAGRYSWISGGLDEQVRKNKKFLSSPSVRPDNNRVAIDLGAGCGFQSLPLAQLGYSVIAVDFSWPLLDELRSHAGTLPIVIVRSDIRTYSSWTGRHPGLIVCMGDTLTHLPGIPEVQDLLGQCFSELATGGRLVLTLRDYSREPDRAVVVIPVLREADRIFLCKLEYHTDTLTVEDIIYSCDQGLWTREAGKYVKIRIDPDALTGMLTIAGFTLDYSSVDNGMITVIAQKA
jgi:2-polyprenyl-3-methyl-5-hydroxy-6-metoxy-1,4-benzoquinol methylase